jgi:predicted aspartyl protease
METETMGEMSVAAKIESLQDLFDVSRGMLQDDQVRRVEVPDALVDTGAMGLSMPKQMVARLGLLMCRTRRSRTSGGPAVFRVFGAVRLTVQGRDYICDVTEIPDDCPVLIGQIPLEGLDFVVDPVNRRLIGNPDHGGEHMMDMF